jgi:branched-chain amino acid aminotransferase
MKSLVSVNGEIQTPENATVSVLDRGFLFGDNIFETLVGFHGKILDVDRHLSRLRQSATDLLIDIPWDDKALTFELETIAAQVECPKLFIRLVITRGEGLGLKAGDKLVPNKIIYAYPAKEEDADLYTEGMSLKRMVSPTTERGPTAKTGNYLRSIVALMKAERSGMQDILWTNSSDEITEASTANIFFIGREGDNVFVQTPSPMSGLLKGITRETIITLLKNAGIPVEESIVYSDEIAKFDEAFVCSTVRGLVPIKSIDKHKLYTKRKNSIYQHIERLYLTWVQTQLDFRVDWNTGEIVESAT